MRETPLIPAAITGNSRLLAHHGPDGELQALYWPHIDYGQHIHTLWLGVQVGDGPVAWTHQPGWVHEQRYVDDTAVLVTRSRFEELGLELEVRDFAVPGRDVLVRRVGLLHGRPDARLLVYTHMRLDESAQYNTVLHSAEVNGLLFYRRDTWLALGADRAPLGFQCGRPGRPADAWPQVLAGAGALQGRPIDCGDVNGALSFDLSAPVTLYLVPGHDRAEVTGGVAAMLQRGVPAWQRETEAWWRQWLDAGRRVATGSDRLDALYRRALISLKLMADERGGGFIAGPEIDPEYKLSGGYAYCWGRDAAYMTTAMDEAGHHGETARFFLNWAARAQEPNGAWLHRHYVDGTLAPSWGLLQIDEGASILFGAWRHFELTGDLEFARAFWPTALRGAEYLAAYRNAETGLPGHSIDLWEKRNGLHAYSSAAVVAGLTGAARLAAAVGEDGSRFEQAAREIREAMLRHLWSETEGRFLRTIMLQGTGPAEAGRKDLGVADMPDISILGVCFPFGLFPADDARVRSTVERLREALAIPGTGGALMRYTGDQYIGGHPWLINSLWLAICQQAAGEAEEARRLVDWAAAQATPLGLLPEQVDRSTGQPTWVTPLAWSCAMFVLALHRVYEQ